MTAYQLIKDKLAFNQWANDKVINWLKEQDNSVYQQEVTSSFASINKLTQHILSAQKYYLSILEGKERNYPKDMTMEEIFQELSLIDQQLLDWISTQEEESMGSIVSIKRSPIEEKYTVATIITHLINHSTYHRGQLLALRQQLNLTKAPKLNYYWYFAVTAYPFLDQ